MGFLAVLLKIGMGTNRGFPVYSSVRAAQNMAHSSPVCTRDWLVCPRKSSRHLAWTSWRPAMGSSWCRRWCSNLGAHVCLLWINDACSNAGYCCRWMGSDNALQVSFCFPVECSFYTTVSLISISVVYFAYLHHVACQSYLKVIFIRFQRECGVGIDLQHSGTDTWIYFRIYRLLGAGIAWCMQQLSPIDPSPWSRNY